MPQDNAQNRQAGFPPFAPDLSCSSLEEGTVLGLVEPAGRQLVGEAQVARPVSRAGVVVAEPGPSGVMTATIPLPGMEVGRLHGRTP